MAQPVRLETIDHHSAMDDTANAVKVVQVSGVAKGYFGEPTLIAVDSADAVWSRGNMSPYFQKSTTGWLANLYGGVQSGNDWAAVFVPVNELPVNELNSALWTYYFTNAEVFGVNMVIWVHDPSDNDRRAEITQAPSGVTLDKAAGWNAHELNISTIQFFYYGENISGSGLSSGSGNQYTWAQFQADSAFSTYTIYRISFEYGWYSTGTFDDAWVGDIKLNGIVIPLKPDSGGTGRIGRRFSTATSGAVAATLAPKTPYRLLGIELKINTAGTTEEDFTVTKDATIGSAYDLLLYSVSTLTGSASGSEITDLLATFGDGFNFSEGDEIDCAWPNSESRTWGLTYRYQTVFGGGV